MKIRELIEAPAQTGREDEDGRGSLRPEWGNMNAPYTNDDPAAVMKYYGTPRVPTGVATHYRIPADSKSERDAEGLGSEPGEHSPLDMYAKYPEKLHDDAAISRLAGGSRDPNYRGSDQHIADTARVRQSVITNPGGHGDWFGNGFASPDHQDRVLGLGKYDQSGATAATPWKRTSNTLNPLNPGAGTAPQAPTASGSQTAVPPTQPTFQRMSSTAATPARPEPNWSPGGRDVVVGPNSPLALKPTDFQSGGRLAPTAPGNQPATRTSPNPTASTPAAPAPAPAPAGGPPGATGNMVPGGALDKAVAAANPFRSDPSTASTTESVMMWKDYLALYESDRKTR